MTIVVLTPYNRFRGSSREDQGALPPDRRAPDRELQPTSSTDSSLDFGGAKFERE